MSYEEVVIGWQEAKRLVREQRKKVESLRVGIVQPLLDAPTNGKPPFICLSFYEHRTGEERLVPALFVGYVPRPPFVTDLINVCSLYLFYALYHSWASII